MVGKWRLAVPALPALLLAVTPPAGRLMHTRLTRAVPGKDAVVREAPKEIELSFSERPEIALSSIRLLTPAGEAVPTGKVAATADTLTIMATVPAGLGAGRYTVAWRTASRDGHPIRGTYDFSYEPAGPAPAAR